ncbi:hypothetical protein AVEN_13168-1 [Araneus ventricosus]|uniref:Tesmin/TSO1-like CXC domain-containing protein n=1 Tax=Araneus ventricosus TaxID=182803 RepID=A0A4Y2QBB2_ARAVE|nr:hypothetical protein AVEN_139682-1 [Araneus ventricosus]GBN60190.1 hypothetical protein AVEN_13168-1 [Araneus ventricosus]
MIYFLTLAESKCIDCGVIWTKLAVGPETPNRHTIYVNIYISRAGYAAFLKSSTKVKSDLSPLPPTKGAAEQHSFRVYLQIQQWLNNQLPPDQWGWARGDDGSLFPVTANDPVAPDTILNCIFCRCTTGCGGRCGCRKAGMQCSSVCGTCHGICTNGAPLEEEEFELDREVEESHEI